MTKGYICPSFIYTLPFLSAILRITVIKTSFTAALQSVRQYQHCVKGSHDETGMDNIMYMNMAARCCFFVWNVQLAHTNMYKTVLKTHELISEKEMSWRQ